MRTQFGLGPWPFVCLVALGTCFLFVLAWAAGTLIGAGSSTATDTHNPWSWVVGGFLVGFGVAILLARPIVVPWTIVNIRRAWRRAAELLKPPKAYGPMRPEQEDQDRLPQMMLDGAAVEARAAEVQQILDEARRPTPPLVREVHVRSRS